MGGSLGLWASVRLPDLITGAVSIYGAQSIDFAASRSAYQIHLAENDPWLPEDDAIFMEATMRLEAAQGRGPYLSGNLARVLRGGTQL